MIPSRPDGGQGAYEDYRQRFAILERRGLILRPDVGAGKPIEFRQAQAIRELSFFFFSAWMFSGCIANARPAVIPGNRDGSKCVLVVSRANTPLAPPGRGGTPIDRAYLACPMDTHGAGNVPQAERIFCPVLNRLRYNVGHCGISPAQFKVPEKSETCCKGNKGPFWDYLEQNLGADPATYGLSFGGVAIPIDLPYDLIEEYATGLEFDTRTLGQRFEETLLWEAMDASGVGIGLTHCTLLQPVACNELDFVLIHTSGQNATPKEEPQGGWNAYLASHSLCVFEVTLGHVSDLPQPSSETGASPGDSRTEPGVDHPKNKIVNHLALAGRGLKRVHYHYLSVRGLEGLSDVLKNALASIPNFAYWPLVGEFPSLMTAMASSFDSPVPIANLRVWHTRMVEKVRAASSAFALGL